MPPAADNKLQNTFRKRDKLKSSLEIEALYREKQVIVSYPLKCYYAFSEPSEHKSNVRVAFTVPKRTFKQAVDRNKLKRRMREAYRLSCRTIFERLLNQKEKQLKLFFIYVGKEMLEYVAIEKSMQVALQGISSFQTI